MSGFVELLISGSRAGRKKIGYSRKISLTVGIFYAPSLSAELSFNLSAEIFGNFALLFSSSGDYTIDNYMASLNYI